MRLNILLLIYRQNFKKVKRGLSSTVVYKFYFIHFISWADYIAHLIGHTVFGPKNQRSYQISLFKKDEKKYEEEYKIDFS